MKQIGVKTANRLSGIPKGTLIGEKSEKKKKKKKEKNNDNRNKEADFSTRELGQPTSTI